MYMVAYSTYMKVPLVPVEWCFGGFGTRGEDHFVQITVAEPGHWWLTWVDNPSNDIGM